MTTTPTRSDANRVSAAIVEEIAQGVTPDNPVFQAVSVTGMSGLGFTPRTVVSQTLRPDRQIEDSILVGGEAGGNFEFEVSFENSSRLIRAALFNNFVSPANRLGSQITSVSTTAYTVANPAGAGAFYEGSLVSATGFANPANNKFFVAGANTSATSVRTAGLATQGSPGSSVALRTVGYQYGAAQISMEANGNLGIDNPGGPNFIDLNIVPGDWIRIGDSTEAGVHQFNAASANGWRRVATVSNSAITFDRGVPSPVVADAGAGKTIRLYFGDKITNGTLLIAFTIERQFQDHSPVDYQYFRGMAPATLELSFPAQSIATGTVGFQGFSSSIGTTRVAGASELAAPNEPRLNTSSNVGRIGLGSNPVAGPNFVSEATISLNNNLREQTGVTPGGRGAALGVVGTGLGEYGITGTLNTYFGNSDLARAVVENEESAFDLRLESGTNSNQAVLFDIPRIKFSAGSPDVTGANTDVFLNLEYQALRDQTLDYTIKYQRYWHLEPA